MSQHLQLSKSNITKESVAVFIIWLFHLSAIIGISSGYQEWFAVKTPLNFTICLVLLFWCFPDRSKKLWIGFGLFFIGGMLAEIIGVKYGFLFGTYEYGANLGPKIGNVPWFIGVNWAVLTLITAVIAQNVFKSAYAKIIFGAALMVFLDLFLEFSAPIFDYWTFEGGLAPFKNYVAWFGISLLFHFIYHRLKIKGNYKFSINLYTAQLVYFAWFYGFYYL